jgi:hypothetical protein
VADLAGVSFEAGFEIEGREIDGPSILPNGFKIINAREAPAAPRNPYGEYKITNLNNNKKELA